ncbi:MAG: hypothetical protein K2N64_01445 [Anaeroplasmataceae bacterium]|nr:hypothetical protein [Anaeroplasmataceae bacterium]
MEEKEIHDDFEIKQEKKILWKRFLKEHLFFLILGSVMSIAYFIVFSLKQDVVYLYLGIAVIGILIMFIGLEALFLVLKKKRNEEE